MENILGDCMLDILSFLDNNVHEHEVEITNDVLNSFPCTAYCPIISD